jgi:hypothetical protein
MAHLAEVHPEEHSLSVCHSGVISRVRQHRGVNECNCVSFYVPSASSM